MNRPIAWHPIPDDDDRGPSRTFPPCRDGDELLARVNGEAVPVTVDRDNGVRFVGEDGEAVEPDAIAERPHGRSGPTQPDSARRAKGLARVNVWITTEQRARLQWIQDEDGHDMAAIIGCAIDQEWEERNQ